MTQPKNKSYPRHGQLWWCDTVSVNAFLEAYSVYHAVRNDK